MLRLLLLCLGAAVFCFDNFMNMVFSTTSIKSVTVVPSVPDITV